MKKSSPYTLRWALREIIGEEALIETLAAVLAEAAARSSISYDSVVPIAQQQAPEVMLEAWDWRLLIPRRSSGCGEWDHRIPVMQPGEIFEMPNIARYLVKRAASSGKWDPETAAADLYCDIEEPQYDRMPALVRQLEKQAQGLVIAAAGINAACRNAGFYHRTGSLILILKGGGIISPKLASGICVPRPHSPVYEINPAVFPRKKGDADTM
ncbi:MAG: hypothetical protein R6U97_04555 [Desulfosalsimonas sp.]